ncbi:hypothetical protein FACS1894153_1270 [Bacteroidia bacterium]|nr:hypothetical protein FACS1894153_1270 [Bacteroidia bacterium]
MKRIVILSVAFTLLGLVCKSQNENYVQEQEIPKDLTLNPPSNLAISIGFLIGGGSLIGVDMERMFLKSKIGVQAGIGISSFGVGINYHLKPKLNSSFVSLVYWSQGFGKKNFYASYLGPIFTFRARKIFQCSLGYGLIVSKGENFWIASGYSDAISSILFNVGVYFPLN